MKRIALALGFTLLIAIPALCQTGDPEEIKWTTPANNLRQYVGEKFTFRCPEGGRISEQLWGTETYTDDSSICTAAAHMGIITPSNGGLVTIEIRPGEARYTGSRRNGISSAAYGSWTGSFIFVAAEEGQKADANVAGETDDSDATDITWSTYSRQLGSTVGDVYKVRCPEGGDINHRVWGTDIYTDDSSVCVAAIHAGLMTIEGGVVTIEIRPGEKKYAGSRRNKVITENYGSWTGSFIFRKPGK